MDQVSVKNVTQVNCGSDIAKEAKRYFGTILSNGDLPIVLIPEERSVPVFITVPTGCACIVQKNGVNLGEWSPGRHFANWRHRVVYVVTKQACTYNYNVTNCATRDNVIARVDLTLVFNITKPVTFVYTLGATHFNNMLKSVSEEATRAMVRSIDHTSIYELRSSAADKLLSILNRTFKDYGVMFVNASVTNVSLPHDLSSCLEDASKVDSQLQEEIRKQEYNLKQLNNKADLDLKGIILKNERDNANLVAQKERTVIEMETKIVEAQRAAERELLQVAQKTETEKVKARAQLRDGQSKAQLEVEEMLQKARHDAKAKMREIDQWAAEELLKSEAELQQAENEAKIARMEADAEATSAAELETQRAYQLQLETLEALRTLAASGKIVLSGAAGEQLIKAISEGSTHL